MKSTLKNNKSILDILIDFFAFLYDSVYNFILFLLKPFMKLTFKNEKKPLELIIDFFAFQYDLVYNFIHRLIDFFAFQYDVVDNFMKFLREYLKWISDIRSPKTPDMAAPADEKIKSTFNPS